MLAHAVGRHRAIRPRLELAMLGGNDAVAVGRGGFCGVGRAFDWLPFIGWPGRFGASWG